MKFMVLALFGLAALCSMVSAGGLGVSKKIVKLESTSNGFWQKKLIWKPRWVKSWQAKTIYVAHWKKVWGPVKLNEWVPLPKPPPGWIKPQSHHVHHHHKVVVPTPVRTYAPAHVDYVHREPVYEHPHKTLALVNPDSLHYHHANNDAHAHEHYGPAYHHHHDDYHLHENGANPNAESFNAQFLPVSLDQLKLK